MTKKEFLDYLIDKNKFEYFTELTEEKQKSFMSAMGVEPDEPEKEKEKEEEKEPEKRPEPELTAFQIMKTQDYSKFSSIEQIIDEDVVFDFIVNKTKDALKAKLISNLLKEVRRLGNEDGGKDAEREYVKAFNNKLKKKEAEFKKKPELVKKVESGGYDERRTEYTNLPEFIDGNKPCDIHFKATDDGVTEIFDAKGNTCCNKLCLDPVLITGEITDVYDSNYNRTKKSTSDQKVMLAYKTKIDGRPVWKETLLPYEQLGNKKTVASTLLKNGINVMPDNGERLASFFVTGRKLALDANELKSIASVPAYGWDANLENCYPYTYDGEMICEKNSNLYETLKPHGDRELWFKTAKKVRAMGKGSRTFRFAMNCAAASLLLEPFGYDGFTGCVYGVSGTGKTLANKAAASMFGSPKSGDGYVKSFKNTEAAIEMHNGTLKNIPLILEDFNNQDERSKEGIQSIIMGITNGIGKGRLNKNLEQREMQTWRLTALATSEQRVSSMFTTSGAYNRLIEIEAKEKDYNWEAIDDEVGMKLGLYLSNTFENNYGFAAPELIKIIMNLIKEGMMKGIEARCSAEIREAVAKDSSLSRTGRSDAVITAFLEADYILSEYLFKDHIRFSAEEALQFASDIDNTDQYNRFHNILNDFFYMNQVHFEGTNAYNKREGNVGEVYGKFVTGKYVDIDPSYFYITKSKLDEIAGKNGVSTTGYLNWLKDRDLLDTSKGDKYMKKTRSAISGGGVMKFYAIRVRDERTEQDIQEEKEAEEAEIKALIEKHRQDIEEEARERAERGNREDYEDELPFPKDDDDELPFSKRDDDKYMEYNEDDADEMSLFG